MRITEVQAYLLSSPLPEEMRLTFYGGERVFYKRDAAFVRIGTDGGLVGYGPAAASEAVVGQINGAIRAALIGGDPSDIDGLRERALAGGSVALAFGGVEVALYDLRGKMEGCPIHELLGGKVRDRIRLYGSAGMYQAPEGYAAEAAQVAAYGFTAYKMRPGIGPQGDLEAVREIRRSVGPDFGIIVDAQTWWRMGDRSYTPQLVEQLAREMAEVGIVWLEEPLPPQDREAYARLRRLEIAPIAAGEHETSIEGFLEIITEGAVDIAQGDVTHHGGYSSQWRVNAACREHGREFAFHNWGTLLECLACAHLGVCFPAEVCSWLEYPCFGHRGDNIMYPFPLADDILNEPLTIENGDLVMPDGPGLGIDVDESVIERYPYIPGPWTVFRITSPPEERALSGDHAMTWDNGN